MSFADQFNMLNEFNILRIICALFLIPHIIAKFTVPQALRPVTLSFQDLKIFKTFPLLPL